MTTIETKIARAKKLGKTSISLWTDEDITDAAILLPDLASECERRGEEVEQLKVALSNVRHGASGMCCQLRQASEAEVSRLRALVESARKEREVMQGRARLIQRQNEHWVKKLREQEPTMTLYKTEAARLRELVNSAPHTNICVIKGPPCTCWKRNLNQPTP